MTYKRGCNKKGPNETCSKCGKRRSCGVHWYKFMWQGRMVRESTKQGNDKVARQIEEFVGREVGRRHAVQHLLIGGIGRLGRAPVLADQRLDRRPVDDVERVERAPRL